LPFNVPLVILKRPNTFMSTLVIY